MFGFNFNAVKFYAVVCAASIALLAAPEARAEDELKVAVVVEKQGAGIKEANRAAIETILIDHFKGKEGFVLIGKNDVKRLMKKENITFFQNPEKEFVITAGKKLGSDLLAAVTLNEKKEGIEVDLWFADSKHEVLIRRFSSVCEGCSAKTLTQGFTQFSDELFKPPYRLHLTTDPAGAEVFEKDKSLGKTPAAIKMDPGAHTIKIVLENYETIEAEFEMPGDRPVDVEIQLTKKTTPTVAQKTDAGTTGGAIVPPATGDKQTQQTGNVQTDAGATGGGTNAGTGTGTAVSTGGGAQNEEIKLIKPGDLKPIVKKDAQAGEEIKLVKPGDLKPIKKVVIPKKGGKTQTAKKQEVKTEEVPTTTAKSAVKEGALGQWGQRLLWTGAFFAAGGLMLTVGGLHYQDLSDGYKKDFPSKSSDLKTSADRYKMFGQVAFGVGGACIVGGLAMMIIEYLPASEQKVAVTPLIAPNGAGVGVNVDF